MHNRKSTVTNQKMVAEIGEDPARYLDRPISYEDQWPMARIRGIDFLQTIRAWKAIERKLGRGESGGPRSEIMQLLEAREAYLEEHGDRPDRVTPRDEPRDIPDKEWAINGEPTEERFTSATAKLDQLRSSKDVATDGGESR